MHQRGDTLVDTRTGDRLTLLQTGADTGGALLHVAWVWPKQGTPPFKHRHTVLQETFAPTSGRMGVHIGGETRLLAPEERVTVPPGVWHYFWNAGDGELRFEHEVRPAGRHQELFELLFRLSNAGRLTPRAVLTDPALLAHAWALNEGDFAGLPPALQRRVFGTLARLTRRRAARGW